MSPTHRQRVRQLFEEHTGTLRRFFQRKAADASDALDLSQEVYVRMLQAGDAREIRDVQAYLFTVARHLATEHTLIKRRGSSRTVSTTDPHVQAQIEQRLVTFPTVECDIQREQLLEQLKAIMHKLPVRSRQVVRMVYFEGLSQQKIGQRLGLSKTMIRLIHEEALEFCWKHMKRGERP